MQSSHTHTHTHTHTLTLVPAGSLTLIKGTSVRMCGRVCVRVNASARARVYGAVVNVGKGILTGSV